MSCVTSVLLLTGPDDMGVARVNAWLAGGGHKDLTEVSQFACGSKRMECRVWAGGFNYLDLPELIAEVTAAPWEYALSVQLLVRGEDDDGFRLVFGNMDE